MRLLWVSFVYCRRWSRLEHSLEISKLLTLFTCFKRNDMCISHLKSCVLQPCSSGEAGDRSPLTIKFFFYFYHYHLLNGVSLFVLLSPQVSSEAEWVEAAFAPDPFIPWREGISVVVPPSFVSQSKSTSFLLCDLSGTLVPARSLPGSLRVCLPRGAAAAHPGTRYGRGVRGSTITCHFLCFQDSRKSWNVSDDPLTWVKYLT